MICPPKTSPHFNLESRIEGKQGDEQQKAFYPGADHRAMLHTEIAQGED